VARSLIVVQAINRFGVTAQVTGSTGDTVNGHYCANDGGTFLRITSTSGSTQTVSVLLPAGVDTNLTAGPRVLTIPANSSGSYSGFFPMDEYGGQLLVNVSSTLLKVSAYSFLA
jgi:hypothetical protein